MGMGNDLYERFSEVRDLYETANRVLGFDVAELSFTGPEDKLRQTAVTQPAIFVHSYAVTQLLAKQGVKPDMAAGHSLGEYTALCVAGSLTFHDALALVKVRGELMQHAGEVNAGTMAAIIGVEPDVVNAVCDSASAAGVVQVANYNSPGQIVISGSVAGVERAMEIAKEKGAKRAIPLVVSGAFHSPLMEFAREGLEKALQEVDVQDTRIPVYSNVTAGPVREASEIKRLLLQQLTRPVRWIETIRNMNRDSAAKFYEIGPGSVLKGLLKRIDRSIVCESVSDVKSLAKVGD